MVDPGGIAKKSVSFDLVEAELGLTIEQAEQSLERFHENRENGEELQNCIDFLHQLRGIFVLIELDGATLLANEAVALANEVPVDAQQSKDGLLAALNQLLYVLRRYVEYFRKRREDNPELLLDIINQYRLIRDAKALPESYFVDIELPKDIQPQVVQGIEQDVFEMRARRLRHMYQVGLLALLRKTRYEDLEIGSKLVSRAAEGMLKICEGSTMSQFWRLLQQAAASVISLGPLPAARKQLLMRVERYFKEAVATGRLSTSKTVSEIVSKDLLHWIARDRHRSDAAQALLDFYHVSDAEVLDSHTFLAHKELLMGPGADVLAAVTTALQEEIGLIKDKLDIIERGMDSEENGLGQIVDSLTRLGHTLTMLSLPKLGQVAGHIAVRLGALQSEGGSQPLTLEPGTDQYQEMAAVADALLIVEQAILLLERGGLTMETDRMADQLLQRAGGDSTRPGMTPYFRNAHDVVVEESKTGLLLAKKSITAYLESGGDQLHLANVPDTLDAIRGAMAMLEHDNAAKIVQATIACIQQKFLGEDGAGLKQRDDAHFLETLADALTSLEYFVDSLTRNLEGNTELLQFAAESLKELGFKVS
ncbi:chemotaxis protein [Allohahella marinimesophila]|uniref:Type IV pilus/biofilm regulator FimL n=1 Tax=Allohahella marinimesophila TaxID=1054972 RepID=A0ABP7NKU1_9GAMM